MPHVDEMVKQCLLRKGFLRCFSTENDEITKECLELNEFKDAMKQCKKETELLSVTPAKKRGPIPIFITPMYPRPTHVNILWV